MRTLAEVAAFARAQAATSGRDAAADLNAIARLAESAHEGPLPPGEAVRAASLHNQALNAAAHIEPGKIYDPFADAKRDHV